MTKYKITNNGRLYEYIRKYKDYRPDPVFRNTVLKGGTADKLFSNPVTSIAYSHEFPKTLGSDYDMDKKDIIKALDFWINDRVLQNEKMLALNGNLKDFEETELKDLIRLKTNVLLLSNDTIFKRFNRTNNNDYNVLRSDTVEFYYQMSTTPFLEHRKHIPTISDSNTNIDGFEMMWHRQLTDLARAAHNAAEGMTNAFSRIGDDDFRDEFSIRMTGGRHSDSGERNYDIGINTNTGEVDQAPRVTINPNPDGSFNPNVLLRTRDRLLPGDLVVNDPDNPGMVRGISNLSGAIRNNPPIGIVISVDDNGIVAVNSGNVNVLRRTDNVQAPVPNNDPNPNNWHVESDDSTGARRYKVVDDEGILVYITTVDLTFESIPEAEQSMREHRQLYDRDRDQYYRSVLEREPPSSTAVTEEHNTTFENMYVNTVTFYNLGRGSTEVEYRDGNGAEITLKLHGFCFGMDDDRSHTIQVLGNNRIRIDEQYYTVTEPIRVSYSHDEQPDRTDNDTFKEYANMIMNIHQEGLQAGYNSYVMTQLALSGPLVDIDLTIYVTGRQIDQLDDAFRNKTVKIFDHDHSRIEIDGERIYVVSMEVTYK